MPWTYNPTPGYQYVILIQDQDGATVLRLVASGIAPSQEAADQARRVLQLAATAPDLYAALARYLALPADPTEMQLADAEQQATAALAKARGEAA